MSLVQPVRYMWTKEDTLATRIVEKGETRNGAVTEPGIQRCDRGVRYRKQVLFRLEVTRQREKGWDSEGMCSMLHVYMCVLCMSLVTLYT